MLSGGSFTASSVLRRSLLLALLCVLGAQHAAAVGSISDSLRIVGSVSGSLRIADLTRNIPSRPFHALTGSQFAALISKLDPREREQATLDEVLRGNLPAFLRHLVPVELSSQGPHGTPLTATIFVTADYLAVGADADFFRIPVNLHSALAIANRFGFLLPTTKVVDAIYRESRFHFVPQPLPAGPRMTSPQYFWLHNQMIEQQSRAQGVSLGALVSGHKKDLVITNRLATRPGQLAIYGWHRGLGEPIQSLSTVHGAGYADYSHGVRLVSQQAIMNGQVRSVYDILRDPGLARVLSDEGAIRSAETLVAAESR
jgi:hypothetical protein